jgi:predicted ATPase
VIQSIQFRHFKALRAASLQLEPFNLIIGPNGSGKTSLIQAILRLRMLSQLPPSPAEAPSLQGQQSPKLAFRFMPPYDGVEARLSCRTEMVCDVLKVSSPRAGDWEQLCQRLLSVRVYLLDHYAMGMPCGPEADPELASNGGNLAAVYRSLRDGKPDMFAFLEAELVRMLPEFCRIELRDLPGGKAELGLVLRQEGEFIAADGLSQGSLYMLALLALAHSANPPSVACIEDLDRGIHPRKLREVRDLLYRLSYPHVYGLRRDPVQVIATTHSPLLLDQFRDHPEEVVIAEKRGRAATFARLIDRPDLSELLQEGSLGDMWFSGILGGVPDETQSDPRVGNLRIPE